MTWGNLAKTAETRQARAKVSSRVARVQASRRNQLGSPGRQHHRLNDGRTDKGQSTADTKEQIRSRYSLRANKGNTEPPSEPVRHTQNRVTMEQSRSRLSGVEGNMGHRRAVEKQTAAGAAMMGAGTEGDGDKRERGPPLG